MKKNLIVQNVKLQDDLERVRPPQRGNDKRRISAKEKKVKINNIIKTSKMV